MIKKFKAVIEKPFIQQFRDVRVVAFMVFGVIVLLVSWSGVQAIEANYELQKQVAKIQQENKVAQLSNQNQKLQNQYYATDQYLELQARKQFGRGLPGEKLVLVPKSVAFSYAADLGPQQAIKSAEKQSKKPAYQRNLEAWRNFFTPGRSGDN